MAKPKTQRRAARPRSRARTVTISLPEELFRRVERARRGTGESRSRFIGKALDRFLRDEEHAALVREYVEGYRRMPECAEEIALAEATAKAVFAENPWD